MPEFAHYIFKKTQFKNNDKMNTRHAKKQGKYGPYIMRDKHSIGNRTEETQTPNILDKDLTSTIQRSKLKLKNLKESMRTMSHHIDTINKEKL